MLHVVADSILKDYIVLVEEQNLKRDLLWIYTNYISFNSSDIIFQRWGGVEFYGGDDTMEKRLMVFYKIA